MNQNRFELFSAAYRKGLVESVKANPEQYFFGKTATVEQVAEKMLLAIRTEPMMVNYSGGGFKRACKELGIKATRKAILEYLEINL